MVLVTEWIAMLCENSAMGRSSDHQLGWSWVNVTQVAKLASGSRILTLREVLTKRLNVLKASCRV